MVCVLYLVGRLLEAAVVGAIIIVAVVAFAALALVVAVVYVIGWLLALAGELYERRGNVQG